MLYALLCDIHGNALALDAVITDAKRRGAQAFIVAGDLVTDYPFGPQVVARLRALKNCTIVSGNRETYLLAVAHGEAPRLHYRCFSLVRHAAQSLSAEALAYLEALPQVLTLPLDCGEELLVTHWFSQSMQEIADAYDARVFVTGHTHNAGVERAHGRLFINPGSVGLSLAGYANAEYALLDGETLEVEGILVPYDADALTQAVAQAPGMDADAHAWLALVEAFKRDRYNHLADFFHETEMRKQALGIRDSDTPDEIWEWAVELFRERGII